MTLLADPDALTRGPNAPVALDAYGGEVAARIIAKLEKDLGGREKLAEALLAAPPSPTLDYVIAYIADPANDCRALSSLCQDGQISLGELLEAFRRGKLATAMVRSIPLIAARTPEIVEDVVNRSVVHEVDCGVCFGKGTTRGVDEKGQAYDKSCDRCDGTGRIFRDPEFAQQKYVLSELAGLGKSATPTVLIDQRSQVNVYDTSAAAHAKLLAATDKLLYGRREIAAHADDVPSVPVRIDAPVIPE